MDKMEESALHKRNTDCVYFLASPLTCKKGIECEYRHSEIARLNPRDCWYWLVGSCLNPTCAFRHPPLDERTERVSESSSADHQSAVTVNKTNVPCHYYYNGFCNKGERCLFMHRPEENAYTWKFSKQASAVVNGPPLVKKMSTGTNSVPEPAEIQVGGTDHKGKAGTKIIPQQEPHQSTHNNSAEQSVSPQISESPSEEAATFSSNSPIHTDGLFQRRPLESTDQGLDDELDNHIEQEDWLESSPGFDVLVNDRSEDLDYEDEALCYLHHDMEDIDCNDQRGQYDYEDNIEYDPAYPDIGVSFEQGMPHWYDHVVEDVCNTTRKTPFPARESVLDRTLPWKRLLQTEMASVDLRDYLKKHRMVESQCMKYFSGRPHSSRLIGKITEKASIGGRGHLHGRLASKVEIAVESRIETENCSSSSYQHGRTKRPRINRSRQQGKRQILSAISGKIASRKKRSAAESTVFTGPKTLAQIKEEKKKALGGRAFSYGRGPSSSDA